MTNIYYRYDKETTNFMLVSTVQSVVLDEDDARALVQRRLDNGYAGAGEYLVVPEGGADAWAVTVDHRDVPQPPVKKLVIA